MERDARPTGASSWGYFMGFTRPGKLSQKTMENHHFELENPLFLWPFSIAMLNYQRVPIFFRRWHVSGLYPPFASWVFHGPGDWARVQSQHQEKQLNKKKIMNNTWMFTSLGYFFATKHLNLKWQLKIRLAFLGAATTPSAATRHIFDKTNMSIGHGIDFRTRGMAGWCWMCGGPPLRSAEA